MLKTSYFLKLNRLSVHKFLANTLLSENLTPLFNEY